MKKEDVKRYLKESGKELYYTGKKLYITTRLYEQLQAIINEENTMHDKYERVARDCNIVYESLVYKLVNSVIYKYKYLEVLEV